LSVQPVITFTVYFDNPFVGFQDSSARFDALRFLAGDAALPDALRMPEVQQYLGNGNDYYCVWIGGTSYIHTSDL